MNKLRESLRLHFECNLSNRKIAKVISLSATTVGHYVAAALAAKLDWSSICLLDDAALSAQLEGHCAQLTKQQPKKKPIDLVAAHTDLKKKGITRELLHQEYSQGCGSMQPVSYTEFCRQYRAFKKTLKPSMRQTHVAGEKIFIDYAGPTVTINDSKSTHSFEAMIFVGVLGASNFTFAEATKTRSLPDWIGSHNRMFAYFGGVSEIIVPDNEKSAVTKACYYDPDVNPNYTALATHYGTAVIPTRPYHPKDKAKAEVAVQVVERWILARLRNQKFFSLLELNQAIAKLLEELNDKPFKKLPGTRRSLFKKLDQSALKPLPEHPYEYALIKNAQVNLDYHVDVGGHYYSVPHKLINKKVTYRQGENAVEIFFDGQCVARHIRSSYQGEATTVVEHMPDAHKRHKEWTPADFASWSTTVGTHMEKLTAYVVQHKPNPECCYRIQLGFMNLAKKYGKTRLEEACQYAFSQHLMSFNHVKSILQSQIDKVPIAAMNDRGSETSPAPCQHKNLRGADYYSNNKQGK